MRLIIEEVEAEKRGAYVGLWVRGLFGFWFVKDSVPDGVFTTEEAAEKYAREALRNPLCPMWTRVTQAVKP